jgi:hypothetical protein
VEDLIKKIRHEFANETEAAPACDPVEEAFMQFYKMNECPYEEILKSPDNQSE